MFILNKILNPLNLDYIDSKDAKIDILESKLNTIKVICNCLLSLEGIRNKEHIKEIIKIIEQ